MRAIVQHEFGGPEVLGYQDVPDLEPAAGQVRIAVEVCGVHLIDTAIRAGTSFGAGPAPKLPMTPGREVAGRVDQVGRNVDRSWLGRQVVTHLGAASGGYASQAVAAVASLHLVPEALGAAEAVAAIGTGRTALGILDQIDLTAADVVLIPSAAGGLGALLVQAAVGRGAYVVGLAGGPEKVALVRGLGAQVAIDYRASGWREELAGLGRAPTLVLDGVGGEVGQVAFELLAPGGTHAIFGWSSGQPHTERAGPEDEATPKTVTTVLGPGLTAREGGMRSLESEALSRAADDSLRPVVGARFPLAQAAEAHRALVGRRTHAKVVLVPE